MTYAASFRRFRPKQSRKADGGTRRTRLSRQQADRIPAARPAQSRQFDRPHLLRRPSANRWQTPQDRHRRLRHFLGRRGARGCAAEATCDCPWRRSQGRDCQKAGAAAVRGSPRGVSRRPPVGEGTGHGEGLRGPDPARAAAGLSRDARGRHHARNGRRAAPQASRQQDGPQPGVGSRIER